MFLPPEKYSKLRHIQLGYRKEMEQFLKLLKIHVTTDSIVCCKSIDGQVHLVRIVRFFLRQQTDKRLTSVCRINELRKIAWTSVFRLIFSCPCLYDSILPVSMFPCLCLHVSMSSSPFSMSPSLHVYMSMYMSPCPCLNVSGIPHTENGTKGKRKYVFLGRQTMKR
jgi:hypothetical protein